jgi:hypothetical protein
MSKNKVLDLSELPNCIALLKYGKCNRLNVFHCLGERCSFKRTFKEDVDSIKCAYQRLSRLDNITQGHIANKYFSGSMPWNEKQFVSTHRENSEENINEFKEVEQ